MRIFESFEDTWDNEVHIVMELCEQSLMGRLQQTHPNGYDEGTVARLLLHMLKAVLFCHERDVVHRDLKLENVLLTSTAAQSSIKLVDFGFSKKMSDGSGGTLETPCGTLRGSEYTSTQEGSRPSLSHEMVIQTRATCMRLHICHTLDG